jgi:alpha-beta hydrolase superfamily lysophospholipase
VAPAVTARAAAACDDHGMTTLATSYADAPRWREYQPFFPPAMRCTPEATPTESRWRWRGLDVHLDRFEVPSSQVKVIVLHGAGANGRIMAPATVIARRHGYETVAPDLPGYGLTAVPRRRLTYQLWIDCAVDLIRAELARDDRPVVLFGVSLGGMLAYQAAATIARDEPALASRLRGLIATTLGDPTERATRRDLARYPLLGTAGLALLRVLATLTDGLPVPMRLVAKMHRISNDPALSALVMRDPHGGRRVGAGPLPAHADDHAAGPAAGGVHHLPGAAGAPGRRPHDQHRGVAPVLRAAGRAQAPGGARRRQPHADRAARGAAARGRGAAAARRAAPGDLVGRHHQQVAHAGVEAA